MDKIIEAQPVSVLRQSTRRAAGQHFTIELNETVKLAWPMVLTQLAQGRDDDGGSCLYRAHRA